MNKIQSIYKSILKTSRQNSLLNIYSYMTTKKSTLENKTVEGENFLQRDKW